LKRKPWLLFAAITTLFWGVWGAFIEIPEKAGFPATLGYCVWALTMVPCAVFGLGLVRWKLEYDLWSVIYGLIIGLTGAGGQLILFEALQEGPAYIVFPVVSLYPVVTILLSVFFLRESASRKHWIGILIALAAIFCLSYIKPSRSVVSGFAWLLLAVFVFLLWGVQAFAMKFSNERMKAESIFFYMMLSGLLLVPVALLMTDPSRPVNWGFKGPYLAAMIQILNAIGALTLVYALRYGKAIVVVPLTALAPVITIVLSLAIYHVIPHPVVILGLVLAVIAIFLLSD
jgi:drug/metabolite transporter (DMT)-like permease